MPSSLTDLIKQLYGLVRQLEQLTGRPFTPDGHMVGSIGEVLVSEAFDLTLRKPSHKGSDAYDASGRNIEIKATQGNKSVAFRSCPAYAIVVRIEKDGTFELIYNGPGRLIWNDRKLETKPKPSNGQYTVSLSDLRRLHHSEEARMDRAVPD